MTYGARVRVRLDPRSEAAMASLPKRFDLGMGLRLSVRLKAAGEGLKRGIVMKLMQPTPGGTGYPGATGIRSGLISATTADLKEVGAAHTTAIQIRTSSKGLPRGHKAMIGLYDLPGAWKHPTFGHKPENTQSGREFFPHPEDGRAVFDLAVAGALEETAADLNRSGL